MSYPYYHFVYVKTAWSGEWILARTIEPLSASVAVAPGVGQASFRVRYGSGQWEDETWLTDAAAMTSCRRFYLQIRTADNSDGLRQTIQWTGWAAAEQFDLHGLSRGVRSAGQIITAQDLSALLDTRIDSAWVRPCGSAESYTPVELADVPVFNQRYELGPGAMGNRSTKKLAIDGDAETYLFSEEGAVWSNRDIIDYLLTHCQPETGPTFTLNVSDSILDALDAMTGLFDLNGKSLRQAMNLLIPRNRGLIWWVVADADNNVWLGIQSMLESDLTIGGITIPANNRQVSVDLWTRTDQMSVKVGQDHSRFYDRIIVRGERVKCCCTLDITEGELEAAWTAAEEQAYKDAAKSTSGYDELDEDEQAALNDRYRSDDRFDRVYCQFRIPMDWDWKVKGTSSFELCNPQVTAAGELNYSANGPYWNVGKRILNYLPLEVGVDYSPDNHYIVNNNPPGSEPEYRSPFVILEDFDGNLVYADKMLPSGASIRPLQREFSLEIKMHPAYLLAINDFTDAEPSRINDFSEIGSDFNTIYATVFIESDTYLQVSTDIGSGDVENPRTLIIEVPGAELWHITDQAIVGLSDAGEILKFNAFDNVLRDDSDQLRQVLAAAVSQYGHSRTQLTIDLAGYDFPATPGQLIRNARVVDDGEPGMAGSVVTAISINFQNQSASITTDHAELDLAGIATGTTFTPSLYAAARGVERNTSAIRKIQTELAKSPVRAAQGGSSTTATTIMAKTQEAGTADGLISVKRWNGTAEVGDAFDVWTNYAKSTSFAMANYYPQVTSASYWPIKYINGEWFLDWTPTLTGSMCIAEVDSDAAGGGYYNCHLQTLDATDWNSDTADQLDDTGDSVVVMNLAEIGADRHELEASDRLICWKFIDDEGNIRYVGIPALRIGTKTDTVNGTSSDTLGGKFIAQWLEEW